MNIDEKIKRAQAIVEAKRASKPKRKPSPHGAKPPRIKERGRIQPLKSKQREKE